MSPDPAPAADAVPSPGRAVLELTDVRKAFGGNVVLDGVALAVHPGFTGLIGPNGAGKTTCLNVISGYLRPDEGSVSIRGEAVVGRSAHAIAQLGVSRTFQTPRLTPNLSVLDNVLVGGSRHHRRGHVAELFGMGAARREERAVRERARELLGSFGFAGMSGMVAGRFPIGSQKIIEVVRALLNEPAVLLLDEPAAGLGAEDVDRLVAGLRGWTDGRETAVVIIEHDLELISRLCPTAAVLHFGRIIRSGRPEDVLRDPVVIEAYLGADVAAER